ncbi:MAG: HAMP domain-containing sensor histidine kinase [Nitrosopumilaceae archaeon]|nr:HAMP domain-containing sensor histidine kinase [Nitrosopumilaceae archaeon]
MAEQIWNLYEHVLEIDPYPSVADLFYVAAPIFMFISLFAFLNSTGKKIPFKHIVLAIGISATILVPSLIFTLEAGTEDSILENAVAVAYPIVDSILLVPAIISFSFLVSSKRNFFWLMIIAGIIVMMVADTIFLFLVLGEGYVDGHPVDILWVSSYTIWTFMMFYAITESRYVREPKEFHEFSKNYQTQKTEKYGVVIGLILINTTVILLLFGINYFIEPREDTILEFFSWILVMLVILFSTVVILLNSKLNRTLQNRTLQLEEASKELIKNERFSAIGEIASRISHDIRNPLSNILMSIELIKSSPPDTKLDDRVIAEKIDMISKNIERISHQVNDVLGFVKNRTLKKVKFSLNKCIQETLEARAIPKNINIKIPENDLKVNADPFQMQIVFNNLIINAIQAIGKNKGKIIFRFSEDKSYTKIEVENDGPKIPEEILPHVFDSLVTTKQVGTGLGLVSCKTIIENHGGNISAKNNPTKFVITLPKNHT